MAGALWDTEWLHSADYGTVGDWAVADAAEEHDNVGGLKNRDELGTAIVLALFTDRKLPDHMIGRYGFKKSDQHEWHGNVFAYESGEEPIGSYLWLLRRAPLSYETLRLAEHWTAEALQTLVRQGRVQGFDIHAEMDRATGRISIHIRTLGPNERMFSADLFPLR